jgi:hypothetical protein
MKNNKKIIEETLWNMMQHDLEKGMSFDDAYTKAETNFHRGNIQRKKWSNRDIKLGVKHNTCPIDYKEEKHTITCRHCGYSIAKKIYTPTLIHYAFYECDLCASMVKWIPKP